MAKERHDTPSSSSSKTTLAVMVVGALLVVGLVAWALTRTVEPAPVTDTTTAASTTPSTTDGLTSAPMTTAQNTTSNPVSTVATSFDPSVGAQPEEEQFTRIAVEDLRAKLDRHDVLVVDVRDQTSYEFSHIPGALHIPLASVEANLSQLPKDREIVLYCTCPNEESSGHAAQILKKHGYTKVSALYGGLGSWESLGYPTKKGPAA